MRKTRTAEYDNFDHTMRELLKVPHSEMKAKLEAEKQSKAQKESKKVKKHDAN